MPKPSSDRTPKASPDIVRLALETAREHGFDEVEIEAEGVKFKARLEGKVVSKATSAASPPAVALIEEPISINQDQLSITAPCVGYYQDGKPALEIGRAVSTGEIVASIQALGIANDVESQLSGEITEVLVRTGDPVEFGQPIAKLKVTA